MSSLPSSEPCHDDVDAGSIKQESISVLPVCDADDSDEVKPPALFPSPSILSDDDDDDDDEDSNHIKNIIGMLTADESGCPIRDENKKTMVDKSTETIATWDLDDLDDWFRDDQLDVVPTSSLTELHQPTISHPSAVPLVTDTETLHPPAASWSDYTSSQRSMLFALNGQYFTPSDVDLASSLIELHQPSISQPSVVPLCANPVDSVQPPAVKCSQTSMFSTSNGQHCCHLGVYLVSSSAYCIQARYILQLLFP